MAKIFISGKEAMFGEVVWFHPEKLYGFAEWKNGERWDQIFFHFNDCRLVDVDEAIERIIFKDVAQSVFEKPRLGDTILFVLATGKSGKPKASPWVPIEDYAPVEDYLHYQNEICDCGHKIKYHMSDGSCANCRCGDEAFEDDDPGRCFQEEPGGIIDCQ